MVLPHTVSGGQHPAASYKGSSAVDLIPLLNSYLPLDLSLHTHTHTHTHSCVFKEGQEGQEVVVGKRKLV